MMIRARLSILACLAVLMSMAVGSATAWAEVGKRYALVIGNSAYGHAEALPNASNDAAQMAQTLSELNFEVFAGFNVSRLSFERLISDFGQQVVKSEADTVLIYYAGHGFELDGVNRLVPIDAELRDRSKIKAETFALDDIIASVQSPDRQTIIFLDACRNNPLAATLGEEYASRGLAQVRTGTNTFVAFATQPGNVSYEGSGSNSPFTEALLTNIAKPGLSLSDMMIEVRTEVSTRTIDRQVPWDQSSLRTQFYFNPRVETAGVVADRQGSGITQSRSGTVQDGDSGGSADPARITIGSAQSAALDPQPIQQGRTEEPAAEQQVAALMPSGQEAPDFQSEADDLIKPLQTRLRSTGCYRGAVDGDWGPRSKAALEQYSKKKGIELASLDPTEELLETLEEESGTVCEQPKAKAKEKTKVVTKKQKQAKKAAPAKKRTAAKAPPPQQHEPRHEPYHEPYPEPRGPVYAPTIDLFGGGFGIGIGGGY